MRQGKISNLKTKAASAALGTSNPLNVFKPPAITLFNEMDSSCKSAKIGDFISKFKRVAPLSNIEDEKQMVQFATCCHHDRELTWNTKLEANEDFPSTIESLKGGPAEGFFPSNENASVQLRVRTFKVRSRLDKQIEDFKDVNEIGDSSTQAAYSFFFLSLAQYLKGKTANEFTAPSPGNMSVIFKCAWRHEIVERWALRTQRNGPTQLISNSRENSNSDSERSNQLAKGQNKTKKDLRDNNESRGKAKRGEGKYYVRKDRCCKCRKNNWNTTRKINLFNKHLTDNPRK